MGRLRLVGFVLVMMGLAGCESRPSGFYQAEGVLTHNGKPLPNMLVLFIPENTSTSPQSSGTTDQNGRYVLRCGRMEGVAGGTSTVVIQDPGALHGVKPSRDPEIQAVLKKYGSEKTSPYKITIDSHQSNLELKLD